MESTEMFNAPKRKNQFKPPIFYYYFAISPYLNKL